MTPLFKVLFGIVVCGGSIGACYLYGGKHLVTEGKSGKKGKGDSGEQKTLDQRDKKKGEGNVDQTSEPTVNEKKDEGTPQTDKGQPKVQGSSGGTTEQQEKTLDQGGQSKEQGESDHQTQKNNLKSNPSGSQSPSAPSKKDHQCKFEDSDNLESSPKKKALIDLLKEKKQTGLQIITDETNKTFKCWDKLSEDEAEKLNDYLKGRSEINPQAGVEGGTEKPLPVKQKTDSGDGWTMFDDGDEAGTLEPILEGSPTE